MTSQFLHVIIQLLLKMNYITHLFHKLFSGISQGDRVLRTIKKLYTIMIKYIAPIFIVLILVSSVLNALGIVKI